MNTKIPAIAYHPGTHMLDEMHARNWTCKTLANKSGIPIEELKEIIVGEINIDSGIAKKLSIAFGTSEALWVRLQRQYDIWRIEE